MWKKILGISSNYFPEENLIQCFCNGDATLFENYEFNLKVLLFAKFQVTYTEYKIETKILGMQIADLPLSNILPSAL